MRIEKFVPLKRYAIGSIVVRDGKIQQCIGDNNQGLNFWRELDLDANEYDDYDIKYYDKSIAYPEGSLIIYDGILWKVVDDLPVDEISDPDSLDSWKPDTSYSTGDIVKWVDYYVKCKTPHVSGDSFDRDKWETIGHVGDRELVFTKVKKIADIDYVGAKIHSYNGDNYIKQYWNECDLVIRNNRMWINKLPYWSKDVWEAGDVVYFDELVDVPIKLYPYIKYYPYKMGDMIYYNTKIWICTIPHTAQNSIDVNKFFPIIFKIKYYVPKKHYYNGDTLLYTDGQTDGYYTCNFEHDDDGQINFNFFTKVADFNYEPLNTTIRVYNQIGDVTQQGNKIYRVVENHVIPDGKFDLDKCEEMMTVPLYLFPVRKNVYYPKYYPVIHNNKIMYPLKNVYTNNIRDEDFVPLFDVIRDWEPNTSYTTLQPIRYNRIIYLLKSPHTSGSNFEPNKWMVLGYVDKITRPHVENKFPDLAQREKPIKLKIWQSNVPYYIDDLVMYNNSVYKILVSHTSSNNFYDDLDKLSPIILDIPLFEPNKKYEVNDIIFRDGTIYVNQEAYISGVSFNDHYWYPYISKNYTPHTYVGTDDNIWKPRTYYAKDTVVANGDKYYSAKQSHTSGDIFNQDKSEWNYIGDVGITKLLPNTIYPIKVIKDMLQSRRDYTTSDDTSLPMNWHNVYSKGLDDEDEKQNKVVLYKIYEFDPMNEFVTNVIVGKDDKLYNIKYSTNPNQTFDSDDTLYMYKPLHDGTYLKIPLNNIKQWLPNVRYFLGDYVVNGDKLYRVNYTHKSPSVFNDNDGKMRFIFGPIKQWQPNTQYNIGDLIWYLGQLLLCILSHLSDLGIDLSKFKSITINIVPSNFVRPVNNFPTIGTNKPGTHFQGDSMFRPDGTLARTNTTDIKADSNTLGYHESTFDKFVL